MKTQAHAHFQQQTGTEVYLPFKHSWHWSVPVPYLPGSHGRHVEAPPSLEVLEYLPGSHLVQKELALSTEYRPAYFVVVVVVIFVF